MSKFKVTLGPKKSYISSSLYGELSCKTDKLISGMTMQPAMDSGILPPVVRSFDPQMRNFLVERTPFFANISYKNVKAGHSGNNVLYQLPIPWTTYLIQLDANNTPTEVRIYCRTSQMYTEEDELCYLPIPNLWADGRTCLGVASFGHIKGGFKNVNQALTIAINAFWTSNFNADLNDWLNLCRPWLNAFGGKVGVSAGQILKAWSKLSMQELLSVKFETLTYVGDALETLNRSSNVPVDEASLVTYMTRLGTGT